MFAERLLYNPHAPLRIHRVADAPSDDIPAEHVYDGCKVHEALSHGYVGDVHLPYLVAVVYFQATEQARELYLGIQALQFLVPDLFRHLLRENKGGFGKKLACPAAVSCQPSEQSPDKGHNHRDADDRLAEHSAQETEQRAEGRLHSHVGLAAA